MRRICWTSLARQDYYDNIDYLLMEWSEQTAQNFIESLRPVFAALKYRPAEPGRIGIHHKQIGFPAFTLAVTRAVRRSFS